MTSAQYLDLVNREDNPSTEECDIKYAQIGTSYIAYALTSLGKFVTPSYNKGVTATEEELEKIFDGYTDEIKKLHAARVSGKITPSFLSF